jgi:hypothetical protein
LPFFSTKSAIFYNSTIKKNTDAVRSLSATLRLVLSNFLTGF